MIIYIICLVIDLLMIYHIKNCKVLTKTRRDEFSNWRNYKWVELESYKIPRITIFCYLLSSLIPFINTVLLVFVIAFYIDKRKEPKHNYGYKLTVIKLVPKNNKIIDWLIEKV